MRYKLRHKNKFIEVRSENAALTHKLQSKALLRYLANYPDVEVSLDYGCGKLRYLKNMRRFSQRVYAVDSEVQISREQIIMNQVTSVREYAQRNWNDVSVMNVKELEESGSAFDFILCSNVLSAIPKKTEVNLVLRRLKKCLSSKGACLIVNQHTNSHFSKWKKDGIEYGYGWLFNGYRGHSYYGIINRKLLEKLLPKAGFKKIKIWIEGQSTFALCS